jgi:starvation-inducible DNA-binding protein
MSKLIWNSPIDLSVAVREAAVGLLNQQLADVLDLGLQARQAHWNVKGPNFIALHELFGEVGDSLDEFADDLAERAVALGGVAGGTIQVLAPATRLAAYPLGAQAGREHVAALSTALASFGKSTRAAITAAEEMGDADTADLFTTVSRATDKLLWQVAAHAVDQT